jgi:hypothetical protein
MIDARLKSQVQAEIAPREIILADTLDIDHAELPCVLIASTDCRPTLTEHSGDSVHQAVDTEYDYFLVATVQAVTWEAAKIAAQDYYRKLRNVVTLLATWQDLRSDDGEQFARLALKPGWIAVWTGPGNKCVGEAAIGLTVMTTA